MEKNDLNELSLENLIIKRRGHIKRFLTTIGLMVVFSLYLVYLDLIKYSENSHTVTYIFIAIGVITITAELLYKLRKINTEINRRNPATIDHKR